MKVLSFAMLCTGIAIKVEHDSQIAKTGVLSMMYNKIMANSTVTGNKANGAACTQYDECETNCCSPASGTSRGYNCIASSTTSSPATCATDLRVQNGQPCTLGNMHCWDDCCATGGGENCGATTGTCRASSDGIALPKKPNGQACTSYNQCSSVCCASGDGEGCTSGSSSTPGTCRSVGSGGFALPKKANGASCTDFQQCANSCCSTHTGQGCAASAGVCMPTSGGVSTSLPMDTACTHWRQCGSICCATAVGAKCNIGESSNTATSGVCMNHNGKGKAVAFLLQVNATASV